MSNFVYLRRGDVLPAVAVAQMLLNRTGGTLKVDGVFGSGTLAAVRNFQHPRGMTPDGVIGQRTWLRLAANETLQIIDCIDVFDPSLYNLEAQDLRGAGAQPILIGGMCNGIEQVVTEIRRRARHAFLVRFHGHGAPGMAGVSDGHGDVEDHSTFRNDTPTRRALSKLRGCLGPYGCIQFMHCNTAMGRSGRQFLDMVAAVTGAPATAGVQSQYAGGLKKTLRFEGATRTSCPTGGSIADWARRLPAFHGMTVR